MGGGFAGTHDRGRLKREKKREIYSGEQSCGDNDVGARRSTLEQRRGDKREGEREAEWGR